MGWGISGSSTQRTLYPPLGDFHSLFLTCGHQREGDQNEPCQSCFRNAQKCYFLTCFSSPTPSIVSFLCNPLLSYFPVLSPLTLRCNCLQFLLFPAHLPPFYLFVFFSHSHLLLHFSHLSSHLAPLLHLLSLSLSVRAYFFFLPQRPPRQFFKRSLSDLRLSYSNAFRRLSLSQAQILYTTTRKNAEALEYRECVGVLCLSVQWLHQCDISSDSRCRHGENMNMAVQG